MSTYTQVLYQLVFATKYRSPVLLKNYWQDLHGCIAKIITNKLCFSYEVGGVEDHLHCVFALHPSVALADLVKAIKLGSSSFIKEKGFFPNFDGWQDGYGAFTYNIEAKDTLIAYVKNQEQHHQKQSSADELKQLLKDFQITYDEKYFI